jgi:hypothetical protein
VVKILSSPIQHSIAADPASAGTIPRCPGLWRDKTGLSIAAQPLSPRPAIAHRATADSALHFPLLKNRENEQIND